jgi:starvation-inducible DNA-binding protein
MEINIGVPAANRKKVALILNVLLSDEFLLYIKTINFHWNVKSKHFRDMHKLFLEQYEMLLQICDDTAERIRSLDEPAFGTMQEFSKHTRLKEHPGKSLTDQQMIKSLLEDHEAIIKTIRKDQQSSMDLDDMGTNNFLLNLLEKQEKMAWMLRASLVK